MSTPEDDWAIQWAFDREIIACPWHDTTTYQAWVAEMGRRWNALVAKEACIVTLDLLTDLGLHGMAKGFLDLSDQPEARGLEHADWLALLLEREMTSRRQRRFEARARAAHLRHDATIEDVDFRAVRGLDRGHEEVPVVLLQALEDDLLAVVHGPVRIVEERGLVEPAFARGQLAHHQTPLMMKRQLLGHTVVVAGSIPHPEIPCVAGSSASLCLLGWGFCSDLLEPSCDRKGAPSGNDHSVCRHCAMALDADAGHRRH